MQFTRSLAASALALSATLGAAEAQESSFPRHHIFAAIASMQTPFDSATDYQGFFPNSDSGLGNDTSIAFGYAYSFTPNLDGQIVLGLPFELDVTAKGSGYAAFGLTELGTVDVLPPQAYLIHNFKQPGDAFRPFVGVGAGYAVIRNEKISPSVTAVLGPDADIEIDNSFFLGLTAGFVQDLGNGFGLRAQAVYNHVSVDSTLTGSAVPGGAVTQKVDANPLILALGISYSF